MNINLMLEAYEKRLLTEALHKEKWDRTAAADRLEIHIRQLYRLAKKYGVSQMQEWKSTRKTRQRAKSGDECQRQTAR